MSEDYPGYSAEATLKKAEALCGKPHSCKVFEDRNPGGCDGCAYKGRITNPLVLGRSVKEVNSDAPTEGNKLSGGKVVHSAFPKSLGPFVRGPHGGVWYNPPPVKGKDGQWTQDPPVLISEHDIYPVKRIYSASEGAELVMRYALPHDPMREFQVPVQVFHSQDEVIKYFTKHELTFSPPSKAKIFMDYIVRWSQHMTNQDAAEQMRAQMGWSDDHNSFIIGTTEIRRDGTVLRAASSPLIHSVSKLLDPYGSLEAWTTAINELNKPSMEIHAFGTLCGFGSPLMRFTTTNGVTVGFTGQAGSGKTGALYSAVSIYGNPVELSLANGKQGATSNSLVAMFLALKNITMGLDEAGSLNAQEVSNLLFWVAHGKGKARMRSDKNALREHEMSASLIAIMTQNQSPTDKLEVLKDSPDGEMARFIEFQMNAPKAMEKDPWLGRRIFEVMKKNYGLAGQRYIQEVFKLGEEETAKLVLKWTKRFENDFGKSTAYRFHENLIGATFAGGEIANSAKIINFDLERIYDKVLSNMYAAKGIVRMNNTDYPALLGEFQNKFYNGTLFIQNGRVIREPKGPLVARAEVDTDLLWISSREIRKFLSELQANSRMFFHVLREAGILVDEGKTRLSTGWPGMSHMQPVQAVCFKYKFDEPK
jgi:hypothetical protein